MSNEKEFNGIIDTENFTEDDYDNFLDYLEDLEDLDDDDEEDYTDITDDDDDDDDSNETGIYDIVTTNNKPQSLKKSNISFGDGLNFNMSSKNGSSVNINNNGISFNISVDTIMDGISTISNSIKEAKYRNTLRQNKKLKDKLKRRK